MIVASILKRLLWTVGYPSVAPLTGKYQVGAIQTRLPDSVACQIHYPADPTTSDKKAFVPYWRPQAVEGLADYSRTSPSLLEFLSLRKHPCLFNAEPIADCQFPIVVFSHGLGGSMEMYTQLCQQIASHGFLVVAMEHEDGSGAYAETSLGKPIFYKRPDDTPYSRQKVLDFRQPFLQQRVDETTDVLDIILNKQDSTPPKIQKVLNAADASKGISLVGHSFGGATMVLAAQKYMSDTQNRSPKITPQSLSLLDVWAFSLPDKVLNEGTSLPTLSVLSQAWLTNPETAQVEQFLQQCPTPSSVYIPHSVHASFSDAVGWLPRLVGSKLYLRGRQEKRHQTIPTAARACVQHIQSALKNADTNDNDSGRGSALTSSVDTHELLQEYPLNSPKEGQATAVVS